ncbi:F0F1 ATP synthase subunit gamma [Paucilactobacillus vaccinostercus DSM 20634]|uniref:ATP synthase gamma chain n=1 Tax=Paucilactobacillus vaccinostercus DSM 20634 TaxID=1423813 RepID=A0A0R2A069_9LACO|nr:F0F1 ATP synthase subunit gamma [Paucilactobacillus vaccinostercus]KRM60558.1 F0F1 ATP synthase subunit gamma [Paucilactobacillus vaccinostercus DSM 20634]RRG09078.1 MAG: F0F1 ATP synthase subunit gamma [Lactobacillus sp.]
MPASLAAVKHKIASTKSTRQITSAMQMVSSSKLNQIQKHTQTYRVYASKVESVVAHLAQAHIFSLVSAGENSSISQLAVQRPVKKTGILVITSDRGLVGSYNSNIIKQTLDFMREHNLNKDNTVFLTVGNTGTDFFTKRGMNIAYQYSGVSDVPKFVEVREIVKTVTEMYGNEVFDELYLSYSHFLNRISSRVQTYKMLPISEESLEDVSDEESAEDKQVGPEYEFEPSETDILSVVLPQYAESLVYGAILDAKTSEHASSTNAMRSASDNADDLIAALELQYNRARQAAITTEITEITGGQAALE